MADAQARRDARRRKILQNSENRLKLITGEQNGAIQVPEITSHLAKKVQLNCITKEDDITKNLFSNFINHTPCKTEQQLKMMEHDFTHSQPRRTSNHELDQEDANQNLIKHTNLLLIIVAVLSRLFLALNVQFSSRLALPFIFVESAIIFLNRNSTSTNSNASMPLVNMMQIFNNLQKLKLGKLIQLLRLCETIGRDFAVYIFTFIWLHVCLENYF